MKHLKLYLAALVALFSLSANAQSWTASEVGAGDFYLYNVGKGQFLTRGNGWGTQASVSPNSALTLTLEEYNGAYKLRTNINGDGKGLERLADPVIYADQSANKNSTWTFTKVADGSNGPIYTIVSKDNHGGGSGSYMTATAGADNTVVGPADAVTDDYGRWQLLQSWITNSVPVNDATGWTVSQTPTFDGGNVCAEFWNKSGATIKQTLSNLPAGSYELIAVALTRTGMTATLNAGSNTMSIATATTDEANNRSQANTWFNNGNGVNKLEFTHTGGNLEIGLTADNTTGDHWLVWRSFVLIYKGLDLSELKTALQALIDNVPALEGTTTAAAYNAAKNYADGIDMDALTTEEAITAVTTELSNLVNAATDLQTNYARYKNVRSAALRISSNVDTNDADAEVAAAKTIEAIDAAIQTLRSTFLAILPEVQIPETSGYIDVTAVMVDNAGVRTNTDYWTIEGTPNGGYSWAVCNYDECEFYNNNFKFYQTLALTPGTWEFGVTGFHRAGNHNTHFYAGEDYILIPGVESSVVNSMAQAQEYFEAGNGKVALKFLVETAQDIEIGIDNQDTQTDKWTIFRDFTLKYYGAPDYSVYEQQWADAVTAANAAKADAANANVTGSELTAVNDAIADAPDGSSKANYLEKIQTLEAATQAFTAAAPAYNDYVAEKANAALLGIVTETNPTSAENATELRNELQGSEFNVVVADYPYDVTEIVGAALVEDLETAGTWVTVGGAGWHGPAEHWAGSEQGYWEQGDANWGANSFDVTWTKDFNLQAGKYVLKVAGRASSEVTVTLNCGETVVPFKSKGNTGLGINVNGVTSYNTEDEFVNNGAGHGWEWRYLPIELAEDGVVTVVIEGVTNVAHSWFSVANAQMLAAQEWVTEVVIDENDTELPYARTYEKVTVKRALNTDRWNTFVLPFDLDLPEGWVALAVEDAVVNTDYTSAEEDGVVIALHLASVDKLVAGTPYFVTPAADYAGEFVAEGVDVKTNLVTVEGTAANFVPVLVAGEMPLGAYYISHSNFYKVDAEPIPTKGMRAYFTLNTLAPTAKFVFNVDGAEVTGIATIENGQLTIDNGAVYNLNGQRVSRAQRGVYIVNGKKVVLK